MRAGHLHEVEGFLEDLFGNAFSIATSRTVRFEVAASLTISAALS